MSIANITGQFATSRLSNQQMPAGNNVRGLTYSLPMGSLSSPLTLDLTNNIATGQIDQIQSAYIDNSQGTIPLILQNTVAGASVTVPARSQGWVPLVAGYAPQSFRVTANSQITIVFCNVPMPIGIWSTGVAPQWSSLSVETVAAISTQLMPADPSRSRVLISNCNGTTTDNVWINPLGGTAAISGLDCFELTAGQTYENFPGEPCWQAITYYCATAGVTLTALSGV